MLYDILCKWDIIPEKITGTLAYTDSFNGNWKKSIPFYRNFPKYLEARLPYTLTFGITDKDGYVIPSDKYEDTLHLPSLLPARLQPPTYRQITLI